MPACTTTRPIKSSDNRPLSDLTQPTFSPPAAAAKSMPPTRMDIWSSIVSGKEKEDSKTDLPPPYIHPMVKRSASSLSKKSLEICTESLGSETGSDGFSGAAEKEFGSDPPKSTIYPYTKKYCGYCSRSALPPPLPSLNLQMRSRRHNGRLVMEAVSPEASKSCFRADRHGGRLLLTFSSDHNPAPKNDDVAESVDDDVEVTSAGGLSVTYAYHHYWRNEVQQPCKRTLIPLKEPHYIATS